MTRVRRHGDAGQAFPIYLTVVGGLLFLAFAYFAVGQAAVNRNGAQTAADAAALAAAQETRDQLADQWVLDILDPRKWQAIFEGAGATDSCWRADQLAAMNDAGEVQCSPDGPLGYTVTVRANKSAGDSVLPVTSTTRAHASARAVIDPLCKFELPSPSPTPEPSGEPTGQPSGEPTEPGDPDDPGDADHPTLPTLTCEDGIDWTLDPDHLTDLPGPEDLFDVHLADD
ncbi:pilus assembly protein TadG-related protein [Streptomyces longwoodensis]|uniref:pilus assembly protein TadG-related protein n=1 Tax=Streptomyces longwoodensis TaxID=68231 RepID=UPI0030E59B86